MLVEHRRGISSSNQSRYTLVMHPPSSVGSGDACADRCEAQTIIILPPWMLAENAKPAETSRVRPVNHIFVRCAGYLLEEESHKAGISAHSRISICGRAGLLLAPTRIHSKYPINSDFRPSSRNRWTDFFPFDVREVSLGIARPTQCVNAWATSRHVSAAWNRERSRRSR
jgi:hypothetical protein